MSATTDPMSDLLRGWLRERCAERESPLLARLRAETAGLERGRMQISLEQGRLMALLVQLLGVRRALEVGTFTGYSALCVAERLPADGELICCDVSEEWTAVARRYWAEAGLADRIELRLGPGADTLDGLIAEGRAGSFDFAFVDADKEGYPGYYEQCLTLLRPGGVLALDNAFMHGRVVAPAPDQPGAAAVDQTVRRAFADQRVDPSLIPIGDGLLLARKR